MCIIKRIVRVRTTVVSDSKIRECVMTMTSFALFCVLDKYFDVVQ